MCANKGGGAAQNNEISQSKEIYNEMLQSGLNSKFAGVRKKAEDGTGNYQFKQASPVSYEQAMIMARGTTVVHTRGENTLIDGYLPNGKQVYFAGKTESPQIQTLLEMKKSKVDTTPNLPDTIHTTTTYDRWVKNNRRKFDDWYFGGQNQKKKK